MAPSFTILYPNVAMCDRNFYSTVFFVLSFAVRFSIAYAAKYTTKKRENKCITEDLFLFMKVNNYAL